MHAARTPAHRPTSPAGPAPAVGITAAGGPAGLDAHPPPDEELLARFGDAIDDRIAEIVDELLEERNSARRGSQTCPSSSTMMTATNPH